MIGYVCKYTPIEIFEFMGEKCEKIEPELNATPAADSVFHPNMCAYSKSVLEVCLSKKYEKIIFTNCCDSIRRVYDILKARFSEQFVYMMELPRKCNEKAIGFYKEEIDKLIEAYEAFSGKVFDAAQFKGYSKNFYRKKAVENYEEILLIGARTPEFITEILKEQVVCFTDLTCSSQENRILKDGSYEESLLNQLPCMRMEMYWHQISKVVKQNHLRGILYPTIKFCDYYSYGYALLKGMENLKILKFETDYLKQSSGQLRTRIEAFMEAIKESSKKPSIKKFQNNIVAGIDSGSTSTNIVLMNEGREILAYHIVSTGAKSIQSAEKAYKELLLQSNISPDQVSYIVATGYGRAKIPFADECVTEISCHGKGAYYFDPSVRTIIDIGGQDSKVIRIDENGEVLDFTMNDKCAAGTGRFLEMMSNTLEMSMEEMGEAHKKSVESLEITSMCSVFAESEVISLIADNKEKADIVKALNHSVVTRVTGMVERLGRKTGYMMTGGVAKNRGVIEALEEALAEDIIIPEEPQITGAVGACLFALSKLNH